MNHRGRHSLARLLQQGLQRHFCHLALHGFGHLDIFCNIAVAVGSAFHYYNAPFETKTVEVGFGFDEIDTVYFKAINDDYNIVSHE